jgi:hypothetical protein
MTIQRTLEMSEIHAFKLGFENADLDADIPTPTRRTVTLDGVVVPDTTMEAYDVGGTVGRMPEPWRSLIVALLLRTMADVAEKAGDRVRAAEIRGLLREIEESETPSG